MGGERVFVESNIVGSPRMIGLFFFFRRYSQANVLAVYVPMVHEFQVIFPVESMRQHVGHPRQERLCCCIQVDDQ